MSHCVANSMHISNTVNVSKDDSDTIFWKNVTSFKLIPSYQNLYYPKQVITWVLNITSISQTNNNHRLSELEKGT